MPLLGVFIGLVFLYSLVSRRIERTVVTAPIAFTAAGLLTALCQPWVRARQLNRPLWLHVAEVGLVLLLFTDASRTNLKVLKDIRNLPGRLLTTGMLLTIALGALAARLVFPALSLWECGIVAAILAPTDAGLGQVIVSSPRVPMKVRQALNVEAGLNDGLSVPFLLFFIALAVGATNGEGPQLGSYILEQLGYGAAIGATIGGSGGWLLGLADRRKWMSLAWIQLGVVALPLLCLLFSAPAGASMFIAAFVAGLAVQGGFKQVAQHSVEFTEQWGQLVNLSVFFLFGLLVAKAMPQLTAAHALYAILSLTLVRMLPVFVALLGTRLGAASVVFMGWFGPRGLASIVLGLVYLEEAATQPGETTIVLAVMMTVLLSIFAHGLSALPGMNLYAKKLRGYPQSAPEFQSDGTTAPPEAPPSHHEASR